MKTKTTSFLIAAIAGFLAGCAVTYFVLPGRVAPANTSAPGSPVATGHAQAQVENARKSPATPVAQTTASRGAERRRVLDAIRNNKVASVDVSFFTTGTWYASDGKLSQQFIDFFGLTPAQAGELSDLVKKAKDEMLDAEKAQAQVSQTDTGGIVIKIPPITVGPDIYDEVMGGFKTVLGDERYNDMMLYNQKTNNTITSQFDDMFDAFGAQVRTITIDKNDDGSYRVRASIGGQRMGVMSGYAIPHATLDELKKYRPELADFIPTE